MKPSIKHIIKKNSYIVSIRKQVSLYHFCWCNKFLDIWIQTYVHPALVNIIGQITRYAESHAPDYVVQSCYWDSAKFGDLSIIFIVRKYDDGYQIFHPIGPYLQQMGKIWVFLISVSCSEKDPNFSSLTSL